MKKNIFITRSAISNWFSLAKSLLDSGHHIHGYAWYVNYYKQIL